MCKYSHKTLTKDKWQAKVDCMRTKTTPLAFFCFVFYAVVPCLANECAPFYDSLQDVNSIIDNNGQITGGLVFTAGINGNAANFNGFAYLTYPLVLFDVPQGSVSLWFKKNTDDFSGGIWQIGELGRNNSIGLFYDSQNSIYFEIKNNSGVPKHAYALNSISDSNYTHIVCTWEQRKSSNVIKLFINHSRPRTLHAFTSRLRRGDFEKEKITK